MQPNETSNLVLLNADGAGKSFEQNTQGATMSDSWQDQKKSIEDAIQKHEIAKELN